MDIKHILCPVDFSSASAAALQLGSALAREHGATIIIAYVEPDPSPFKTMGYDPNSLEHHELWHTLPLATDVTFVQRLLSGEPADEILQFARDNKVDLIVMGSHGRSGVARMLTGSVAEAVIRRAEVPVLTVKQPTPMSAPVAK
jgi:nucleotide-binding universal stress UspA family protein